MKYVLITGACGGMGAATLKKLHNEGYGVIALDRRPPADTDGITFIETDVTDKESISRAVKRVREITDELYSIVHFAGIYRLDSLVECRDEKFIGSFDVNVFGVYRINRAFILAHT